MNLPDAVWLRSLPTLSTGQCCDLKVDTGNRRTWLCRVGGGVSIERFDGKSWRIVAGSCTAKGG